MEQKVLNLKTKYASLLENRLIFKITISIFLVFTAIFVLMMHIFSNYNSSLFKNEVKNEIIYAVANASTALGDNRLSQVILNKEQSSNIKTQLQSKLQEVMDNNVNQIINIYVVTKNDKSFECLLSYKSQEDVINKINNQNIFSSKITQYLNGISHMDADEDPYYDDLLKKHVQTGYSPILNDRGETIGVLCIDIDVSKQKNKEDNLKVMTIVLLGISTLLVLLFGIFYSRHLFKPVKMLVNGTEQIIKGNFDVFIPIRRKDEFGKLANLLNVIAQDLKVYDNKLKSYGTVFENRVIERTDILSETNNELQEANKQIREILDSISQAIFTINSDLRFNENYSSYAKRLFGNIQFEGKSILDILFPHPSQLENKDNMKNWLKQVFESPNRNWNRLKESQPIKELMIVRKNQYEIEEKKFITIDFKPIIESYSLFSSEAKDQVKRVIVTIQDITDKRLFEKQIKKKEQEYKDNINQIIEIIKMDQELFMAFIDDCKENLTSFEPKLIALKDDKTNIDLLNDLFRYMHTIKGNARAFKLERIAGEAHSIENIFSRLKDDNQLITDQLLDQIFNKFDRLNSLFDEIIDVYDKITNAKSIENGKARNKERQKRESEIIKIKVTEFEKLTQLMTIADNIIFNKLGDKKEEDVLELISILEKIKKQLYEIEKINLSRLFLRFPRMVRDISLSLGKKIKLVTNGEDIEIDKNVFDKVGDPLVHILRNSIDHGIEHPSERLLLGKPEEGTIKVNVAMVEENLIIEISDDGRGLDVESIKQKAVDKGLISKDKALSMSENEAMYLIFLPSLSTNNRVTDISGRGVGMDVVKDCIRNNLNGKIILKSEKNKGTQITFEIPIRNKP